MARGAAATAAALVAAVLVAASMPSLGAAKHKCVHDAMMELAGPTTEVHHEAHQHYPDQKPDPNNPHRHLLGTFGKIRIFLDKRRLSKTDTSYKFEQDFICESATDKYIPATQAGTTKVACKEADVLTPAKQTFLENTVLKKAQEWFQATLSVQRVVGNLKQTTPTNSFCSFFHVLCCKDETPSTPDDPHDGMPPEHYTTGVANTDFILYVTARPTQGATIAWALTCQSDQNGRPISGMANFGPALIKTTEADIADQVSTAIHEIGHALGFSSSKFWDFRAAGTNERLGSSNVVGNFNERGHSIKRIITKNVVSKVKKHFDCNDWPNAGGELEDFGSSGTAGSHWEKRVFMNEFMTGTASLVSIYSEVSIALFEDTGWYQVNYARAEKLAWGNGEGCTFASGKCSEWSDRYFCTERHRQGCSPDALSKAVCNRDTYPSPLPSYYQYFAGEPNAGGLRQYADYCPFYESFSTGACSDTASNRVYYFYGEVAGPSSRCFTGDYILKSAESFKQGDGHHYGCLETRCDPETAELIVVLKGSGSSKTEVTCPRNGGRVAVPTSGGFIGNIDCPPTKTICTGSPCDNSQCGDFGTCQEETGECVCDAGYSGTTKRKCDLVECPRGTNGEMCGNATYCQAFLNKPDPGTCKCPPGLRGEVCQTVGCSLPPNTPTQAATGLSDDAYALKYECSGPSAGNCSRANPSKPVCICNAGLIGDACELTDCPGNPKCGGNYVDVDASGNTRQISKGSCDEKFGLCTCASQTVLNINNKAQSAHFAGANCSRLVLGATPYGDIAKTGLEFYGEKSNRTGGSVLATPVSGKEQEWVYLGFNAPTNAYSLTIRINLNESKGLPSNFYAYANYVSSGIPTRGNADFHVSGSSADTMKVIKLEPTVTEAPNNGRRLDAFEGEGEEGYIAPHPSNTEFNKAGDIVIAMISQDPKGFYAKVSLERDPCATLKCVHGTCKNKACECFDQRPSTAYGKWSGALCDVPDCPGVPPDGDCGTFRGTCVVDTSNANIKFQYPKCQCRPGFSGDDCMTMDTSAFEAVSLTTDGGPLYVDAKLGIGGSRTYFLSASGDSDKALFARVINKRPGGKADPILLAKPGEAPSLLRDEITAFDNPSWVLGRQNQTVNLLNKGAGVFFITVMNGRYATDDLDFTLMLELTTGCPKGLNNCNNHGTCARSCTCDKGWSGLACQFEVHQINGTLPYAPDIDISVGELEKGEWKYYVYAANKSVSNIDFRLSTVEDSPRAQPVMLAVAVTEQRSDSLKYLFDGDFDFDGYSSRSRTQLLQVKSESRQVFYYIGVHNTRNAIAPVKLRLRVSPQTSSPFPKQVAVTPGGAKAGCLSDAAHEKVCRDSYCHKRAVRYIESASTGEQFCQCESGWGQRTWCNTPEFTYFGKLQQAAQNISFLCNLCREERTMERFEMLIYKIPQPLQTKTGLTLTVTAIENDNGTVAGNPSVLVSEYLPRSLLDFAFVSSSFSKNESVTLDRPSPTGRYWMMVYANEPGRYRIQAFRESLGGTSVLESSFLRELGKWMTTDQTGIAATALAGTVLGCVLLFCVVQLCQSGVKGTKEKAKSLTTEFAKSVRATSTRDFGAALGASGVHAHRAPPKPRTAPQVEASHRLNLELQRLAAGGGAPPPPPGGPAVGAPPPPAGYPGGHPGAGYGGAGYGGPPAGHGAPPPPPGGPDPAAYHAHAHAQAQAQAQMQAQAAAHAQAMAAQQAAQQQAQLQHLMRMQQQAAAQQAAMARGVPR